MLPLWDVTLCMISRLSSEAGTRTNLRVPGPIYLEHVLQGQRPLDPRRPTLGAVRKHHSIASIGALIPNPGSGAARSPQLFLAKIPATVGIRVLNDGFWAPGLDLCRYTWGSIL